MPGMNGTGPMGQGAGTGFGRGGCGPQKPHEGGKGRQCRHGQGKGRCCRNAEDGTRQALEARKAQLESGLAAVDQQLENL